MVVLTGAPQNADPAGEGGKAAPSSGAGLTGMEGLYVGRANFRDHLISVGVCVLEHCS